MRVRLWVGAPADVPLLTLNTARGRIHWQDWRKSTAAWRQAAADAASWELEALEGVTLPLEARVLVEAQPVQTRGPLADPMAHAPTVKAIIDGLGDAGWLIGDDPVHVRGILCWAPIKRESAGVIVSLITDVREREGLELGARVRRHGDADGEDDDGGEDHETDEVAHDGLPPLSDVG